MEYGRADRFLKGSVVGSTGYEVLRRPVELTPKNNTYLWHLCGILADIHPRSFHRYLRPTVINAVKNGLRTESWLFSLKNLNSTMGLKRQLNAFIATLCVGLQP